MKSTKEIVAELREKSQVKHPGQMGYQYCVDKSFLSEVADRLEELEKVAQLYHNSADTLEPITHFFQD